MEVSIRARWGWAEADHLCEEPIFIKSYRSEHVVSFICIFLSFFFDFIFFLYFLYDYFYNQHLVEKIFLIEILILFVCDFLYELTNEFLFMASSIVYSIPIFFFSFQDAIFYHFDFYHFFNMFFAVFLLLKYFTLIVLSRQEQLNINMEDPYVMVWNILLHHIYKINMIIKNKRID